MFQFITDTAMGGWNAVGNIASGAGQMIGDFTSSFFPTTQRSKVISETLQPAGGWGNPYRPIDTDAASLFETNKYAANGWLKSPYELQNSIPAKRSESKALADQVDTGGGWGITDLFADIAQGARSVVSEARGITTVVNDFMDFFRSDREPISEGPAEIGNSRGTVINQNPETSGRPDVITAIGGAISGALGQVRGLFGLNYEGPQGPQQVAGFNGSNIGSLVMIGLAITGIILLLKKK